MKNLTTISLAAIILVATGLLLSGGCKNKKVYVGYGRTGAPVQVVYAAPADGATGVDLNPTLEWTNTQGATEYNVYLGNSGADVLLATTENTSITAGPLNIGTVYYWRVDAVNFEGVAVGQVWSFTTANAPAKASNPQPVDGASGIDNASTLNWSTVANADAYVVYLGTSSPAALAGCATAATYDPGTLTDATKYFWRVDTVNAYGTTQGDEWTFTTQGLPGNASNPTPADNASGVGLNDDFSWDAALLATNYKLYLDTISPPLTDMGWTNGTTFDPGTLERNTTYYWQVTAFNSIGNSAGPEWSFRTGVGPMALDWAQNAGLVNNDRARCVASFSDDTILVVGYFWGCCTFGIGTPQVTTIYTWDCQNHYDTFIAKYAADGTFSWAKTISGTGTQDDPWSVDTYSDGSFVVAGGFGSTAIFGPGEGNETTLTSASSNDIFVARYNADGTLRWARMGYAPSGTDDAYDVAALDDGSCIAVGYYYGCTSFSYGEADAVVSDPNPNVTTEAAFIIKYSSAGDILWFKNVAPIADNSGSFTEGYSVAVNPDGTFYIGGFYEGSTVAGQGEANETLLVTFGNANMNDSYHFLARYNADGTLDWAKDLKNPGNSAWDPLGLAVLSDGSAVICGYFYYTLILNHDESDQTILQSDFNGNADIFFARYNADGTIAWAKSLTGEDDAYTYNLVADGDDSFYLCGEIDDDGNGTVFGKGEANETTIDGSGGWFDFLAHYDSNGELLEVRRVSDNISLAYWVNNIALTSTSIIYVCGDTGTITFGPGEPNETTFTAAGEDAFILKYTK